MPARNAPSASDSPASSVSAASPSVTSRRFSMKSSGLFCRATTWNHTRIGFWPAKRMSTNAAAALREPEAEHCAAQRFELRQAELEADREHQEDDAEFGQVPDVGGLGHEGERMRADREPDEEIAQDGRQANQPAQDDRDNRCAEQNQNQLQCLRHRERGATRESGRESM